MDQLTQRFLAHLPDTPLMAVLRQAEPQHIAQALEVAHSNIDRAIEKHSNELDYDPFARCRGRRCAAQPFMWTIRSTDKELAPQTASETWKDCATALADAVRKTRKLWRRQRQATLA